MSIRALQRLWSSLALGTTPLNATAVGRLEMNRRQEGLTLLTIFARVVVSAGMISAGACAPTTKGFGMAVERHGPRKALSRQIVDGQPYLIWNAFVDIVALTPYERLHPRQRPAHLVFWYGAEVNNGGHYQYFENSAGRRARETVVALDDLEFPCHKAVLSKAVDAWDSRTRRPARNTEELVDNALDGEFDRYDSQYHACEPSADRLLERYVADNRDLFVVLY